MIHIGRVCIKIAGRDAGKRCVIVDVLDKSFVLIDGETRRRKCNILHLEPLDLVVEIEKGAGREAVAEALKKEGIVLRETKPKNPAARPVVRRRPPKSASGAKGVENKAGKKEEKKPIKQETEKGKQADK